MNQILTINPQMATVYYIAKSIAVLHNMTIEKATQIASHTNNVISKISESGKGEKIDIEI
ncbi:MAG TPA: hypothetical protein PLM75_10190 [bacterium]|nr:hypothetical protein [bacterium]HPP88215.1 hypothetical protein [bacterium]